MGYARSERSMLTHGNLSSTLASPPISSQIDFTMALPSMATRRVSAVRLPSLLEVTGEDILSLDFSRPPLYSPTSPPLQFYTPPNRYTLPEPVEIVSNDMQVPLSHSVCNDTVVCGPGEVAPAPQFEDGRGGLGQGNHPSMSTVQAKAEARYVAAKQMMRFREREKLLPPPGPFQVRPAPTVYLLDLVFVVAILILTFFLNTACL